MPKILLDFENSDLTDTNLDEIRQIIKDALHEFIANRDKVFDYVDSRHDYLKPENRRKKYNQVRHRKRIAGELLKISDIMEG